MKYKLLHTIIGASLLGSALWFNSVADAAIVSNRVPLLGYANQTIAVYRAPGNMQAGSVAAETALIQIKQVRSDGWAYGSYPASNGRRANGWFRMSDIQPSISYKNCNGKMLSQQTVYRTTSMGAGNGIVSAGESVLVIGEQGGLAQIIYKQKNSANWRIGWVIAESVQKAQNISVNQTRTQTNTASGQTAKTASSTINNSTSTIPKANPRVSNTVQNTQNNSNRQNSTTPTASGNNALKTTVQKTGQPPKPTVTVNNTVKNTATQSQGLKLSEVGSFSANQRLSGNNSVSSVADGVVNRFGVVVQKAPAYTNAGLSITQGIEYASVNDIVVILEARGNACKITYPAAVGLKDRWVAKSNIDFYNGVNYQIWKGKMKWRADAHHVPDLNLHPVNPEYADKGDAVTVINEGPIAYLVSYPLTDGTHKARWVDKNAVERVERPQPDPIIKKDTNPIIQPVKRDDVVTQKPTANVYTPYRPNVGDLNGDGEIGLTDVSKVNLHFIGLEQINAQDLDKADLNGDGEITITDVSIIKLVNIGNDNIENYKRRPYKIKAKRAVNAYSNYGLTSRYGSVQIPKDALIHIYEETDTAYHINYPANSSTEMWVGKEVLKEDGFQPYEAVAKRYANAYETSALTNWDHYSKVFKGDPITVIGETGNAYHVKYPGANNKERIMWVDKNILIEEPMPVLNDVQSKLMYAVFGTIDKTRITCDFNGYKNHPDWAHEGIDMVSDNNKRAPVYAVISGEITRAGGGDYNTFALYDKENNKTVVYLHFSSIAPGLKKGGYVNKGDLVGYQGYTGAGGEDNTHVHIEVVKGKTEYANISKDKNLINDNPYNYWDKVLQ